MPRSALDVARRCLSLELLFQRYVLDTDVDEPAPERERARSMWLSRIGELGVDDILTVDERAYLEKPVGALSKDDLDDLYGRATGAAILLWSLDRVADRPTLANVELAVAEHGLLGDGSIAAARTAATTARLRPEEDLDACLAAYRRLRGKAREVADPERVFAEVGAHHLTWVLDATMAFDDDDDVR